MTNNRSDVFLIDDDENINFYNEDLISEFDQVDDITVHEDCDVALDFIESACKCEKLPNIWFVDINMPKMNGFQLLDRAIKKLNSLECEPLIYMLSSSSHPADKKECEKRSYIKGFLSKPLSETQLSSILLAG